mmetsp:Transcript_5391/g.5930  ORF Transcript_5391/g.5930 Transcript_5391/m.5930 type:complete len:266 (+) Transcript_5391:1916-2713(+)
MYQFESPIIWGVWNNHQSCRRVSMLAVRVVFIGMVMMRRACWRMMRPVVWCRYHKGLRFLLTRHIILVARMLWRRRRTVGLWSNNEVLFGWWRTIGVMNGPKVLVLRRNRWRMLIIMADSSPARERFIARVIQRCRGIMRINGLVRLSLVMTISPQGLKFIAVKNRPNPSKPLVLLHQRKTAKVVIRKDGTIQKLMLEVERIPVLNRYWPEITQVEYILVEQKRRAGYVTPLARLILMTAMMLATQKVEGMGQNQKIESFNTRVW